MVVSPERLEVFARTIIEGAAQRDICLRAFGGIGIRMHCRHMKESGLEYRQYNSDIDLVASSMRMAQVDALLLGSKLEFEKEDGYNGGTHRVYSFRRHSVEISVDVYFGQLRFNHLIPKPYFDKSSTLTIPLTQLLITKLAIVEMSLKDIIDICAILAEHEIGNENSPEVIQERQLVRLWGSGFSGWCISMTCMKNVERIRDILMGDITPAHMPLGVIISRLEILREILISCKKSVKWWLRDRIGENFMGIEIQCYDDVV